nr:hypothetical protein CFP56_53468 [Quercus suber]
MAFKTFPSGAALKQEYAIYPLGPLSPPYPFIFPHHTHTHTHFDFCLGQKDAIKKGLVSMEDVEMATSQGIHERVIGVCMMNLCII